LYLFLNESNIVTTNNNDIFELH